MNARAGTRRATFDDKRLTIPRFLLILLLCGSSFLATARPSFACSCAPPSPPDVALMESEAVFSGRVASLSTGQDSLNPVTFEVAEVWKGPVEPVIGVWTGHSAMCGYSFDAGQAYLVYAYYAEGVLQTNNCLRTALLAEAEEDLAVLGEGQVPVDAPPSSTEEGGANSFPWARAGLVGVALLSLVFLISLTVLSKRRRSST